MINGSHEVVQAAAAQDFSKILSPDTRDSMFPDLSMHYNIDLFSICIEWMKHILSCLWVPGCVDAEVPFTAVSYMLKSAGFFCLSSLSTIFLQLACGTSFHSGRLNPSFIAFVFHLVTICILYIRILLAASDVS